jgi:hypothetical protein
VPQSPRSEKRLANVNARTVMIVKVATRGIKDDAPTPESDVKDPAAVALGRKGGLARAQAISAKRRSEIARKAAKSRWRE